MTQPDDISLDDILATKAFQNFVESARHFCLLIETHQSDNPKEFLQTIKRHLSALYALGLDIPHIYLTSDLDLSVDLSDTEKKTIRQFISDRVPFSYYWIVLNPVDMKNLADLGTGDLLDDLEDIYCDIKCGLIMLDKDDFNAKENGVWKLKFDYDSHWSTHCIEALQVIHDYIADN
ncbi:DUF5063 domain-containing protein [Panacibacter sp. DH6]|uniref:DUF5063 domain-containing protein n=1 Tax=Panacibacter microcysteis TaxID=2793269 RepID=A0A931H0L4_9BACT|nr:DUF5063 domain-containing protein [Panacibacter microcysteis]